MRYQNLILAVAVLALACATWLERPKTVTAQTPYSQPVKVVNTGASQAVPVSGTVNVGNTVPVSGTVSGTVTVGNSSVPVTVGNSSVPVSGTVTVGNTAANPVPVQPGITGTPFTASATCTFPSGGTTDPCTSVYAALPSTAVIESVSCSGWAAGGLTLYAQLIYVGSGNVVEPRSSSNSTVQFRLTDAGPIVGGFDAWMGVQQLRAYVQANQTINLEIFRNLGGTATPYDFTCTVSGVEY